MFDIVCLPPFNLSFLFFEIKPLVPRTSNLRDSTVLIKGMKTLCMTKFLAHLSPWLMVSYCDRWMSLTCVVHRLSSTIASKDISS